MVRTGSTATAIQAVLSNSFESCFRTKQARKTDQDEMVCYTEYKNDCIRRFGWDKEKILRLWKEAKNDKATPRITHKERGLLLQMEGRILICADDIVGATRSKVGKPGTVANPSNLKKMIGEESGFGKFGGKSRNTSGPLRLKLGKEGTASTDEDDDDDDAASAAAVTADEDSEDEDADGDKEVSDGEDDKDADEDEDEEEPPTRSKKRRTSDSRNNKSEPDDTHAGRGKKSSGGRGKGGWSNGCKRHTIISNSFFCFWNHHIKYQIEFFNGFHLQNIHVYI